MGRTYVLEPAYLATEYSCENPLSIRVVGTLLDKAFENVPDNPELDRICALLAHELQPKPRL